MTEDRRVFLSMSSYQDLNVNLKKSVFPFSTSSAMLTPTEVPQGRIYPFRITSSNNFYTYRKLAYKSEIMPCSS